MKDQMEKEINKLLNEEVHCSWCGKFSQLPQEHFSRLRKGISSLIRQSNLALIDRLEKEKEEVLARGGNTTWYAIPIEALDKLKKEINHENQD